MQIKEKLRRILGVFFAHYAKSDHETNTTPIALEKLFDIQDRHKNKEEKSSKPSDYMEVNIGTNVEPKMIKIGKSTLEKERNEIINLLREYRDV